MLNKRLNLFRSLLFLLFLTVLSNPLFAQFAGGSGTQNDPYLVATAEHLNSVRNYLHDYFLQTEDINLGIVPYNEGAGWLPIGTYNTNSNTLNTPFTGSYDGGGHTISNLFINNPNFYCGSLFGYTYAADLKNIDLVNVNISGSRYTGALTGLCEGSILLNCSVTGYVSGSEYYTGGMAGKIDNVSVENCHTNVNVVSTLSQVGGLVGGFLNSNIEFCHAEGDVSGNYSVGGLAGVGSNHLTKRFTVAYNYSTGNVSGETGVGGCFGSITVVTISDCFARSNVTAIQYCGGFVGLSQICTLTNCYSTGLITASTANYVGGFVGCFAGGFPGSENYTNCYWDTDTSGQVTSVGGYGRTTNEMTYPYAINTFEGWDFVNIWEADQDYTNSGYPRLRPYSNTAVPEEPLPIAGIIINNYPNPFRERTNITFKIAETAQIQIDIFNCKGQKIRTLSSAVFTKGEHSLAWDCKADNALCAAGIYLVQISGKDFREVRKITIIK